MLVSLLSMDSTQDKRDRAVIDRPNQSGWFTRMFDPMFIALMALSCVGAAVGVYRAAFDGEGDLPFTMSLFIGAAALPTAWAVLRGLWHPDPEVPAMYAAFSRTIVAPLVSVWPAVITGVITVLVPSVNQLILDSRRPDGWHYTFGVDEGAPWTTVAVFGGLLCIIIAMLLGLVLSVVVVLPFLAFRRPAEAVESNMMDTSADAMPANTKAIRGLSILLILVFAVPTFIIVGKDNAYYYDFGDALRNCWRVFTEPEYFWGDFMWVLGVFLIPIGVLLVVFVKVLQRPNHAVRDAAGMSAWGDKGKGALPTSSKSAAKGGQDADARDSRDTGSNASKRNFSGKNHRRKP